MWLHFYYLNFQYALQFMTIEMSEINGNFSRKLQIFPSLVIFCTPNEGVPLESYYFANSGLQVTCPKSHLPEM